MVTSLSSQSSALEMKTKPEQPKDKLQVKHKIRNMIKVAIAKKKHSKETDDKVKN